MMAEFDGVKVFSATKKRDRDKLDTRITEWLRATGVEVARTQVIQSSDRSFHCLSLILFYKSKPKRRRAAC